MRYTANEPDSAILHAIGSHLASHLAGWYGPSSRLTSAPPKVILHKSSFFIRHSFMDDLGRTRHILSKIRRRTKMRTLCEAVAARELHELIPLEYKSLEDLYGFFGPRSDSLRAVRPLCYLEEFHAIVMEEFPSKTLRQFWMNWQAVLGFPPAIHALIQAAEKTGVWLLMFNTQMHETRPTGYSAGLIDQLIQERLSRLEQARVPAALVDHASKAFGRSLAGIHVEQIDVALSHGDLTCDNVLISDAGEVCTIDGKFAPAPIYFDLSLILMHPETFLIHALTQGVFLNRRMMRAYRKAILEGYETQQPLESDLLAVFCALQALDKWVMYEEVVRRHSGLKGRLSPFALPLLRSHFGSMIRRCLSSIP